MQSELTPSDLTVIPAYNYAKPPLHLNVRADMPAEDNSDTKPHVHGPGCNHGHTQEPIVRSSPKVGRNDPCSCNSGKKYKKCCGKPA